MSGSRGLAAAWRLALWSAALGLGACAAEAPPSAAGGGENAAAAVRPEAPLAAEDSLPPVAAPQLTAGERRGREVYDTYCWSCHGWYGHGDGPLARGFREDLPDLARAVGASSVGALVRRVRRAPPAAGATAVEGAAWHGLREPELRAAIAYIATFAEPGARGNPAAGRLIYGTYCVHCHGLRGAGDGALAAEQSPPPADLRALDLPRQAEQVFALLKTRGPTRHRGLMPEWGRLFGDQQLWDVIAYLPVLTAGR